MVKLECGAIERGDVLETEHFGRGAFAGVVRVWLGGPGSDGEMPRYMVQFLGGVGEPERPGCYLYWSNVVGVLGKLPERDDWRVGVKTRVDYLSESSLKRLRGIVAALAEALAIPPIASENARTLAQWIADHE